MQRIKIARRRDATATRAAILAAAHQRFWRESYENVSLREVAGDVGIDVALIARYFGSKEGLFREVVSDDARTKPFREMGSDAELPEYLAQLVADEGNRKHRMESFIIMLRSASSPKAREIIREQLRGDVLEPLVELIGGERSEMRANMLLAILMGFGVLRSIMLVDCHGAGDESPKSGYLKRLFSAALEC